MIEASDHSWSNTQALTHGREGGKTATEEKKKYIHSHKYTNKEIQRVFDLQNTYFLIHRKLMKVIPEYKEGVQTSPLAKNNEKSHDES